MVHVTLVRTQYISKILVYYFFIYVPYDRRDRMNIFYVILIFSHPFVTGKLKESICSVPDDFESNYIFEEILKTAKTYSMSKSFEVVRNRLISFHSAVRQLQKHTKGLNNNNMIFKMERDNIFSMLTDIYLDLLEEYNNMDRAEDAYHLLFVLNEKLVRALKRSYTGNEKTIEEVCTCQDRKCAESNCTRKCDRFCFAEDLLTKYPCSNSSGNHSVHVDIICSGKAQCPKGEDEVNCQNGKHAQGNMKFL